jgi:hypothetical protein
MRKYDKLGATPVVDESRQTKYVPPPPGVFSSFLFPISYFLSLRPKQLSP